MNCYFCDDKLVADDDKPHFLWCHKCLKCGALARVECGTIKWIDQITEKYHIEVFPNMNDDDFKFVFSLKRVNYSKRKNYCN